MAKSNQNPAPLEPGEVEMHGIIHSDRGNKEGQRFLTFEIPQSDGHFAIALALHVETVMRIRVKPLPKAQFGGKEGAGL